ncbi:MAG: hypothetical protein VKS61_06490 [Candidatus Sericytochromatia bacterium]|nr:hypothetical protein [Candidatus Sericytochromatia bacterium]
MPVPPPPPVPVAQLARPAPPPAPERLPAFAVTGLAAYGVGPIEAFVLAPWRVIGCAGEPPGARWVPAASLQAWLAAVSNPRALLPAGPVPPEAMHAVRLPATAGQIWLERRGATHVRFAARGLRFAAHGPFDVPARTVVLQRYPP